MREDILHLLTAVDLAYIVLVWCIVMIAFIFACLEKE
jgi:hypothetical protein